MDKKQFIEKCRKEFKEYRKNMMWSNEEGQTVAINLDTAENFLVNKLSKCWDMARDQAIDIHKDFDSLDKQLDGVIEALTSKQEDKK